MVDDLKPRYTTKRLRQEIERARENDARHIAALEAQLAASTGAVKVKRSDILTKIALWADDEGLELSMGQGDDLARRILSALEASPPAPKVTEDRLPSGHIILEQADMPDGRVSQTVRVEATSEEYERVVHANEAYGGDE